MDVNLKNQIVNFLRNGIKEKNQKMLGIEVEHFIVDKNTEESVSYYGNKGIKTILENLMECYPNSKPIFGEDIIGFFSQDFNITLEPAAQIEISINPYKEIETIEKIYKEFLDNLNSIINKFGYKILTVSCQPKTNIDNIKMVPKRRFRILEKYYEKIGTRGIDMMKGTCSVQVSIDYFSEDDFRKKLQIAYFLTPFFKLLTNNSNCYQGKSFSTFLKRTEIYRNTDPKRCGTPKNIFSENYGFENYAEYLYDMPMVYYKKNNEFYETDKTFGEYFENQEVTEDKIWHISSIVFPDIRAKKYLEIRGADLMPFEYILGYFALIKGIFYYEDNLNTFSNMVKDYKMNNKKIDDVQNDIIKSGWNAKIYDTPAKIFAKNIIELIKKSMTNKDIEYLAPMFTIVENEGLLNIKK
jgi:glutamate--cysteine ligase